MLAFCSVYQFACPPWLSILSVLYIRILELYYEVHIALSACVMAGNRAQSADLLRPQEVHHGRDWAVKLIKVNSRCWSCSFWCWSCSFWCWCWCVCVCVCVLASCCCFSNGMVGTACCALCLVLERCCSHSSLVTHGLAFQGRVRVGRKAARRGQKEQYVGELSVSATWLKLVAKGGLVTIGRRHVGWVISNVVAASDRAVDLRGRA